MDLGLFGQVLWRSRLLVLAGFVAACLLAVFALARPEIVDGRPTLRYRAPVVYQSTVQLLVTKEGFGGAPSTDPTYADLAALYSQLIMGSDELQRVFGSPKPPLYENVLAAPLPAPNGQPGFLPIIQITGIGPSPTRAKAIADRAATTFSRARVTDGRHVVLDRVAGPLKPTVYLPRKKSRAIFVFAIVLMLTIAAAFLRENRRKRTADVEAEAPTRHVETVRQEVSNPDAAGRDADEPSRRVKRVRQHRNRRRAGVEAEAPNRHVETVRQNAHNGSAASVEAEAPNGRAEHMAPGTTDSAIAQDK